MRAFELRFLFRPAQRDALHRALARMPRAEAVPAEPGVTRRRVRSHGALVECTLAEPAAGAEGPVRPGLAFTLREGEPQALVALALGWQARHGLWLDPAAASPRSPPLAAGPDAAAPVRAEPPAWSRRAPREMSAAAVLRTVVGACLAQIVPNAAALAAGSADAEHVHQLRVGLRRLRAVTREMATVATGLPPDSERPLKAVFDRLGEHRDAEVMRSAIAPLLQDAGAPLALLDDAPRGEARAVADLVRDAAFQGALIRLLAFAQPRDDAHDAFATGAAALARLRRRLDRLLRRTLAAGARFDTLDFAGQHRVRKRMKRVRYVAGLIAPLFDARAADAWLRAAGTVQDVLGRAIDLGLAQRRFEAAATGDARAWFAVGWLQAQARREARRARRRLRRLQHVDAFW